VHYLLQKHVTRTVPRPLVDYPRYTNESFAILDVLRDRIEAGEQQYFEFGAGWDLFHNLLLYCFGVQRQFLMDLTAHMRPELVNEVIRNFQRNPPRKARRIPDKLLTDAALDELREHYGITYHAPSDARLSPLNSGSVGLASTINTLEHVPFDHLAAILHELKRICSPSARIAMQIDYSDHYSHADQSITPYNFLRFSESQWKRYNTHSHYQNRRRHSDYRTAFLNAGFRIVSENIRRPENWEDLLTSVPLDGEFRAYDRMDVGITSAIFSLQPA